mgnify:CR=1 FL=1
MYRFILLITVCLLFGGKVACAQSETQARNIITRTLQLVQHPGGVKLRFHAKALGLYSYAGEIIYKGNKSVTYTSDKTIWNDGYTAWVLNKKNNSVTILKPENNQSNRIGDQLNLVKDCQLELEAMGDFWKITMKPKKKKGFFSKGEVLISKKNYQPIQLRLKYLQVWITIRFLQFNTGEYPESLFIFDPQKYPNTKIIDKRKK